MGDRDKALVRVDATGAAHPLGREASREMRQRQGQMVLLPAPGHALVMRRPHDAGLFWLAGEVQHAGIIWDLIGMAGQGNWTGELVVVVGSDRRSIFLERGILVGASSTAERERLGEILYHYGVLTREQISVVADAVSPDVRFGEAAVALGYLSRERLFEVIGKQVEEIVYATMLVQQGSFYFVDSFDEVQLSYRLNLSVQHLLMEGVRRMDEIELFRARIPSGLHVPAIVPGARLDEGDERFAVFSVIDGQKSVDEIGRELKMGSFDTTRAVFQLLQSGLVALHPPRPTGPEAIVTLFNQAIALILEKVDEVGGGLEVREQLASFATASGVYDALFRDAGPASDGTLAADRIAETVAQLAGPENSVGMLSQWLYEYASFAMFIAEPLLRTKIAHDEAPPSGMPHSGPLSEGVHVSRKVSELLAPLAPEG
jgi:hypothetical protein